MSGVREIDDEPVRAGVEYVSTLLSVYFLIHATCRYVI
jgi:hypothetical protein